MKKVKIIMFTVVLLCILSLLQFQSVVGKQELVVSQGLWWEPGPIPGEVVEEGYIPYSELLPALREIEKTSNRVQVEVIGKSAGGHDILLVTVSDPSTLGRLGTYKSLAKDIVEDPERVLLMLEEDGLDFKAPVFINGPIHGGEMGGVDAALQVIELLAYSDSEEVQEILSNLIVLINPSSNPDGRIADRRTNDNGFDLNRDSIRASQPETRAMISVLRDWNPLIDLNPHGYMGPRKMLLEPCTMPHCPNAQIDLIERWLYPMSLVQEEALIGIGITAVEIPYRDYWADGGWDDYPPTMFQMYAYYHGSLGQCSEAPRGDYLEPIGVPDDILANYVNMMAGLTFAAEHRVELLRNQLELFIRGTQGYGWDWEGPAWNLPDATVYEPQGSLYEFPYAYVIPMDELQIDPIQAAKLVDHVIFHGVKVMQASRPFSTDGVTYPAGSYVVSMRQAKSGLANCLLWSGQDVTVDPGVRMYDDAAWNFPELWGVTVEAIDEEFSAKLTPVKSASYPIGDLIDFPAEYTYALKSDTNNAVNMVNELLDQGIIVGRTDLPFTYSGMEFGVGTFIIPADQRKVESTLNKLVMELHLKVYGIDEDVDISYRELEEPKIAILKTRRGISSYGYNEIRFTLSNFGFKFDVLNETDVQDSLLADYDVLYVGRGSAYRIPDELGTVGVEKLMEFIEEGGRYIGVADGGARLVNYIPFLNATAARKGGSGNGVARVNYDPLDSVTAYYPEDGYAFVYRPYLFEDLGPDVKVAASLASEDMFLAGYWPDNEDAEGYPIIIHGTCGDGEVTLIGTPCDRRALSEVMYRLLANSIYG